MSRAAAAGAVTLRLATLALLVGALAGCAGGGRAQARPAAAAPPPAPPAASGEAGAGPAEVAPQGPDAVPQHAGAIGAPWDTAGTASGKASRRAHVYPSGLSPLGKRLVDSLPDPAGVDREAAPAPAAPAPASAAPAPPAPTRVDSTQSIGESGCWEVQLLVSSDRDRAEEMARRVEKDLDLAAWVQRSGGLYRVRAGGCLSPDGAGTLARQLKEEGYPEAFRVMRESP